MPAIAQPAELSASALAAGAERINAAIAARRLPGGVWWVERLGATPHHAVFGQAAWEPRPEPLAADAVFDVASLTKPVVTATLIMQLVEAGQLKLDEPVKKLMPELLSSAPITWRHLLTHSSGLPASLPLTQAWSGRAAALALAWESVPTHVPGSFFRYSDINFILLGALIERLAGAPLASLAQARVLKPLVMNDSSFLALELHRSARIVPTEFDGATMLRGQVHDPTARRMGGAAGHAGLFSTAADLARFARMVLGGGVLDGARVLREDSVTTMTRPASPPGLALRGLGWDIDSPYARPRGKLYPRTSFGHTGFTGCAMWIDPGSQSFSIFLSNRVHPRGSDSIVALYEELGTAAARAAGLGG
jgi:CubicO group peptidase (beta-lactamase class C family)